MTIVLGTAQLGMRYGIANRRGQPSVEEAVELIRMAAAEGVAALDVAPAYGSAELIIGAADVDLPIFTKSTAADVGASVRASLKRLDRASVDVLFLHDPEVVVHDPEGSIERAALLIGTQIGALGASVYTAEQFEACLADPRISCIQAPINAVDRRLVDTGLLTAAARAGKRVYARSLFLQGALLLEPDQLPAHLDGLVPVLERLRQIAQEAGLPLAELLLRYVAQLAGVTGVLIGCESAGQLVADMQALHAASPMVGVDDAVAALPRLDTGVLDPRTWPMPSANGAAR